MPAAARRPGKQRPRRRTGPRPGSPLPPALALGDEHRRSAARRSSSAAEEPRSGAARPVPSPRPSPGPGACAAPGQRSTQPGTDPRQPAVTRTSGTPWRDASVPGGRQPPRHRISIHVTTGLQEREETEPTDSRRRTVAADNPGKVAASVHRLQRAVPAATARALRGDERQHTAGRTSCRWLPTTVKNTFRSYAAARTCSPAPPTRTPGTHQPAAPDPETSSTGTVTRTEHAQVGTRHRTSSHRHRRPNPSRVAEITRKITYITCMSGNARPGPRKGAISAQRPACCAILA